MLLEQLRNLGAALPVSETPTTADVPLILSGLIRYTETGSLEPPKIEEPDPLAAAAAQAENSKVAELETKLREAETANAATAAAPSPVLPPPAAEPAPAPAETDKPGIETVAQGPGPTREELLAQAAELTAQAEGSEPPTAPAAAPPAAPQG